MVTEGVFETKLPAAQLVHALQASAFGVLLHVPVLQLTHVRSVELVPGSNTRSPATQVRHELQAVALPPGPNSPAA